MAIASKFLPRVKKKVIAVEKLLEGSVAAEKKKVDDAKREASEERKAKSEEQLEKKEEKGDKLPFKKQRQKVGDFLSNFITNMVLGAAVMKLVEFTQTDTFKSFIDGIAAVADFIENVGGFLLNGLITFVDWAYGLYDGLRGFVYDNFGEEGLKKFDTFMANFNTFLNTALIAIMAFLRFKFLRVGLGKLGGFITKIFRRGILRAAKRLGLKFFGKAATKFLGQGLSAAKGFIGKGLSAVGKGVGGLAAKIFGKSAGVIAPALKGAMGAVKNFFGRIPIVGPIVVAIVSLLSGEPPAQALFKALGAALGGALGTFIPIPVLGTLLGETIGAFVGDLLYYGIIEGNWKKAGKVFGQTLSAILSAGGKVLKYIGGVGKRFIDDFPMVDVPDFKLGSLIGDLLAKANPVLDKIINFEISLPAIAVKFLPLPEDAKTALTEGFSIKSVLDSLPGLREVLGAFAQFIPGLNKHVKNGALMKIPNLLLFTPFGAMEMIPHIGKSLFPGLFDGKPSEKRSDVPPPPDSGGGFMDFLTGGTQQQPRSTSTPGGKEGSAEVQDMESQGNASGRIGKKGSAIYLHWTAGNYNSIAGPYHTVFTGDGTMHRKAEYDGSSGGHTYNRNAGAVGLSLAANPDIGQWPTEAQRVAMAKEAARIAKGWGWSSGDINMNKVLTHGEAGSNIDGVNAHENYGPFGRGRTDTDPEKDKRAVGKKVGVERWDLDKLNSHKDKYGSGGDEMRERIKGFMRLGGPTRGRGLYVMGEEGKEFVIDADSTAALEGTFPGFLQAINRADGNAALEVLRNYASYDSNEPEQVLVPVGGASGGTPASQQSGGVVTESAGGDDDPFERLYMGG